MGSEINTPTTASLIQNAQAQLTTFITALANLNTALTSLSITNIVPSPTVAATAASINATTL